ncbi:hypothetical protein CDEF62S_04820 [Castellaniella defragrans]
MHQNEKVRKVSSRRPCRATSVAVRLDYLSSIRRDGRKVYMDGHLVEDVTSSIRRFRGLRIPLPGCSISRCAPKMPRS